MSMSLRSEIIRTKIKEIEEGVRLVEDNLPDEFEDFSKLGLVKDGIYKRMEFAIENVFDICAIINADLELGIPSDDADIFNNLVEHDIFDENMRNMLKRMKGFRNIVVHRYGRIDDRLAYTIMVENLPDFHHYGVSQPIICSLSVDQNSGTAPVNITFTLTINSTNGTVVSWSLDVDNDEEAEYSGSGGPPSQLTHTYNTTGTFTAKLTVTHSDGWTDEDTEIITVSQAHIDNGTDGNGEDEGEGGAKASESTLWFWWFILIAIILIGCIGAGIGIRKRKKH